MVQIKHNHKGINLTSKSEGKTVGIKRKAPSVSHRTLDFHLQGDIKSDSHKKVMREKVEAYGEAISGSLLQRGESSTAYNYYYMPSIACGTPATTLSFKECDDLQKPVVNAILPKWASLVRHPDQCYSEHTVRRNRARPSHGGTKSRATTISTRTPTLSRHYWTAHSYDDGVHPYGVWLHRQRI
jgi:hypothetical protein